ncbi:MAG: hypothetical protein HYX27_26615 [Acidobacteria bacterium]|nr:hypothetical protein [Acidobacteriota bacterium]
MQTRTMAEMQTAQEELPKISIEDRPTNSENELLKKRLILGGIILLVTLFCTAIIHTGSVG